jgi:hypothetical protein
LVQGLAHLQTGRGLASTDLGDVLGRICGIVWIFPLRGIGQFRVL